MEANYERVILDSQLRQLKTIENEVATLDKQLQVAARQEAQVPLLMTIPGVNYIVALGLLAALGDIRRFQDGNHAASYLGLAPSTRQSGDRCYHGRITKAGNGQTRCLLTQSAQHASRPPGPLGAFFRRLAKRRTAMSQLRHSRGSSSPLRFSCSRTMSRIGMPVPN